MINFDIEERPGLAELASNFKAGIVPAKRDPLDPAPLLEGFSHYEPMLTEMEAEVAALQVTDHESVNRCTEMANQLAKIKTEIEKARKDRGAPYKSILDALMACCKPFVQRLDRMYSDCKQKGTAFLIEEDRKRRQAEAKAKAEAERIRKEAEAKAKAEAEAKAKEMNVPVEEVPVAPVVIPSVYIPPAKTEIRTDSGSMKIEYEMIPEIADFRKLPDECLQARAEQIKAAVLPWINARGKAGIYNDPGVVWSEVPKTRTRVGR